MFGNRTCARLLTQAQKVDWFRPDAPEQAIDHAVLIARDRLLKAAPVAALALEQTMASKTGAGQSPFLNSLLLGCRSVVSEWLPDVELE